MRMHEFLWGLTGVYLKFWTFELFEKTPKRKKEKLNSNLKNQEAKKTSCLKKLGSSPANHQLQRESIIPKEGGVILKAPNPPR